MAFPKIYQENLITVLTKDLRYKTDRMHFVSAANDSGCTAPNRQKGKDIFPDAKMERYSVFKTSVASGTYSHHAGICKWRNKYCCVFSHNTIEEDCPPQSTLISISSDGKMWSSPSCIAAGCIETDEFIRTMGIMVWNDKLVAFVQRNSGSKPATEAGMSANDDSAVVMRTDVYVSDDAVSWDVHENLIENIWFFEAPRLTKQGHLMVGATVNSPGNSDPAVLLWPGKNPLETPEIVRMPYRKGHTNESQEIIDARKGEFFYGESSWYQDDDERIWMFMRDESQTCNLFVAISEDNGHTWTEPMRSDMPDSMSRIFAGRLDDGRYYIMGNLIGRLLDRSRLMLSLSEDGAVFDKMSTLVDDDTKQSYAGHLKANGYQYPNALVDGDKLIVAYSVNKEDIECGIVNISKL